MNGASDIAARGRKDLESSTAWQAIEEGFFATGHAAGVQRALTQLVDRAAVEAFQASLAPVLSGSAVLAAGSFARGELFPYSNADILIVREDDSPHRFNDAFAEFCRLLWAKGVRPNPRVCSIPECLALVDKNVDLGIELIDRRMLAGDSAMAAQLDREFRDLIARHGQPTAQRLVSSARARHEGYRNTPSHRQPDVEETPGGLRDLRLMARLEKLCPDQVKSSPGLSEAADFLSFVRCFLHYRTRESRNVLDLAMQEAIAGQFGRGATPSAWMRQYFRHARAVFRETRRALDSFEVARAAPPQSDAEFSVLDGRLYLQRPADLANDPEMVFRLIEFVARHGIPPAPETERRLEEAKGAVAAFCHESRPLWSAFKTILSSPHAPLAFRLLQQTDLFSSVLPEWAGMEGAAANGTDHAYTIDEHTLMAFERISALPKTTDAMRQRFRDLLSEIEDRAVLLFAALFYQMGPDAAALGREAAARIQLPASDPDLVTFLIEYQATLSEAASSRNLDDPATLRRVSERIGTVERLRLLAALTYGDISATCSEAMLPLRLDQLWRTYAAARRQLTRELETDRIQQVPATVPESAEFIKGFPARYLRAHTAEEIARHTRLYRRSRPSGAAVELEPVEGAYKLTVVAQDRPALFGQFAGAISSFGLDIVTAEAFSNADGVILDTFVITDPKRTLALDPPEAERLQDLINRVALGKTDARRLFRNRPLPQPTGPVVEPQIQFDSEACETSTLVEIIAEDRPGLLYSLATTFSSNACNIDTVLIDTKGHRAIDVFYVSQNGRKLPPELQAALQQQLISACLG